MTILFKQNAGQHCFGVLLFSILAVVCFPAVVKGNPMDPMSSIRQNNETTATKNTRGRRRLSQRIHGYGTLSKFNVVNNGWHDQSNLGECEGDCDSDDDCNDHLVCKQREGSTNDPFGECLHTSTVDKLDNYDYCVKPVITWAGWDPTRTLGVCEGDCDNDGQCEAGLKCIERDDEPIPQCGGFPKSEGDYCVPVAREISDHWGGQECQPCGSCNAGLQCMIRHGTEPVPGCSGTPDAFTNYCVVRPRIGSTYANVRSFKGLAKNAKEDHPREYEDCTYGSSSTYRAELCGGSMSSYKFDETWRTHWEESNTDDSVAIARFFLGLIPVVGPLISISWSIADLHDSDPDNDDAAIASIVFNSICAPVSLYGAAAAASTTVSTAVSSATAYARMSSTMVTKFGRISELLDNAATSADIYNSLIGLVNNGPDSADEPFYEEWCNIENIQDEFPDDIAESRTGNFFQTYRAGFAGGVVMFGELVAKWFDNTEEPHRYGRLQWFFTEEMLAYINDARLSMNDKDCELARWQIAGYLHAISKCSIFGRHGGNTNSASRRVFDYDMTTLYKNGYPENGSPNRICSMDRAVQLCENSDCTGKTYWAGVGEYREIPWYIGNNKLSHIKIPPSMSVKYYQDRNYGGWNHESTIYDTNLNFNLGGHDNAASSMKVYYHQFDKAENPNYALQRCEGDCDDSNDCSGSLKCWKRDGNEAGPPGCSNTFRNNWDYCYDRTVYGAPYRNIGTNPSRGLNLCEGDCDDDDDCNDDLRCFERDSGEGGPAQCSGSPYGGYDYCRYI